jgi:hypothetical protein
MTYRPAPPAPPVRHAPPAPPYEHRPAPPYEHRPAPPYHHRPEYVPGYIQSYVPGYDPPPPSLFVQPYVPTARTDVPDPPPVGDPTTSPNTPAAVDQTAAAPAPAAPAAPATPTATQASTPPPDDNGPKEGLSTVAKVGIGAAVVTVVGGIVYAVTKKKGK